MTIYNWHLAFINTPRNYIVWDVIVAEPPPAENQEDAKATGAAVQAVATG
jgi:hypothetical protein